MRPSSFDQSQASDWSRWVLEHEVPDVLGIELPVGHSIPVSVRRGSATAAVIHLRRQWQDEDEPEAGAYVESGVDMFVRTSEKWVNAGGGGSGGSDFSVLIREVVPPRAVIGIEAETTSSHGDIGCTAVSGVAGTEAASVEVEQDGAVVRRSIEAPLGWFVVSADGDLFTVRVGDRDGVVLGEALIDVAQQFS